MRAGHYPEARSENKGVEPEGLEVGTVRRPHLPVRRRRAGQRRRRLRRHDGTPRFLQLLPTGIGPRACTRRRGVLAVTSETDGADEGFLARPIITLFELGRGRADVPVPRSADDAAVCRSRGSRCPASPATPRRRTVWAVSDSCWPRPTCTASMCRRARRSSPSASRSAASTSPTRRPVTSTSRASRPDPRVASGSPARADQRRQLAAQPARAHRRRRQRARRRAAARRARRGRDEQRTRGRRRDRLQGGGDETVWVAIQREWADDPAGLVKIGRYDVAADAWTFAHYPLDTGSCRPAAWSGCPRSRCCPTARSPWSSATTSSASAARNKRIYGVDPTSVTFAPIGKPLPMLTKTLFADVLDDARRRQHRRPRQARRPCRHRGRPTSLSPTTTASTRTRRDRVPPNSDRCAQARADSQSRMPDMHASATAIASFQANQATSWLSLGGGAGSASPPSSR